MKGNFWRELKKPIFGLAPMDGVTDEPLRQTQCLIAKPDVVYTEFISAEGFAGKPEKFSRKIYFEKNEKPVVVQIFGYTPECFTKTIAELSRKGFSGIDINMGCPAKTVLQRGGGAALIGNYSLAKKIISACLEAIKKSGTEIPLSVKTRITGEKNFSRQWFDFLSGFNLAEITVHGRRLKQGNSGPVDWEEIAAAAEKLKAKEIICLGNGGLKSLKEAREKCKKYQLDGVLLGQAALGNPWIFDNDYLPSTKEVLATILSHGELAWRFYQGKGYLSVLKHFGWYPRKFRHYKELKKLLLKTRNLSELEEVISVFKNKEGFND
ncbi:MAG: putative tRNA-dihydrouridine synthase [Microgenomates group bacterium ADurb.Bin219]|nr:MAG: putative tRNA-dihydrouridine synthase [Microgenomates group bacterium ADurb.Bin219]HNP89618.1 tRNA-dihydrouridine synthase [Candidatus Woesebacteria bacterium]